MGPSARVIPPMSARAFEPVPTPSFPATPWDGVLIALVALGAVLALGLTLWH
ncbi:MAG: hypothetical protein GXO36_06725 [Chloroflexi bacterium]|nr:hypothetical protein [Chloroflexota bacterium]